jgi:hypothetical protein
MNKILTFALLLVVVAVGWFAMQKSDMSGTPDSTPVASQGTTSSASSAGTENPAGVAPGTGGNLQLAKDDEETDEYIDFMDEEIKPATELYNSADEAMTALTKAAIDYDDLVLEQFAELDKDCSWCPELYEKVQAKLFSADLNEDEKSYFAEVLAISGRVDNVSFLVDAIGKAPNPDTADIFTEALEITYGDDEVVSYLGEQLDTSDETLQESVIAALTNHGSKQAIDLLYKQTLEEGDPDGYYSLGIGLGEIIPDDDALPYLVDLAKKKDDYSHLAVKALLNSGNEGLKVVMDIVSATNDPDVSKKLLADAIDHVPYEEDTEAYLNKVIETSSNPAAKEFAQEILEDFKDLDDLES